MTDRQSSAGAAHRAKFLTLEALKWMFRRVLANGQTIRWVTQKPILAGMLANIAPVKLAVDVGCGGGTYATELLAAKASTIVALDLSYEHAWITRERARRQGLQGFYVLVASAESLPLKQNIADLILCSEVLEHVPNDLAAAQELGRVAKNRASLLCTVPHPPDPCPNPDHVREGYREDEIRSVLGSAGFQVGTPKQCMFGLTRAVMRWCHILSFPLPLLFLCQIEHWLAKRGVAFKNPYDLLVAAQCQKLS